MLQELRGGSRVKGIPTDRRLWHMEGGTESRAAKPGAGTLPQERSRVPWQGHPAGLWGWSTTACPDLQQEPCSQPSRHHGGLGASPIPAHLEPQTAATATSPRCAGTPEGNVSHKHKNTLRFL